MRMSNYSWAPSSVALAVTMALVPGAMLPMSALAQSGSAADLAEIVVTARKREESLQDVPIAVTAFSSEQLVKRGISELEDVAMATPGLVFEDFSSSFSAAPVMRGLTQVNVSSEVQNVATFVDGVYLQRGYSVDIGLADVSRIEVVKGPQSALYGQNAFGGAINYVLNKPGEEFEGDVELTTGTDGRLDYKLALGGPLVDGVLGVRAYFGHSEFDGTWKNEYPGLTGDQKLLGNRDDETYSLMAVITPSDAVSIELSYMHVDRDDGMKPGWNVNSGDAQNSGNCGPIVPGSTRLRYICGEIALSPVSYQTAASTRGTGNVINIPVPGFRNETDFYRADVGIEVSDALSLVYQYGKVKAGGQEISSPAVNAISPTFGLNLSAFASGVFEFGFFNAIQKEGSINNFDSHELRLDYAPEGGALKTTLGLYRSEFEDVYLFNLASFPAGQFMEQDPTSGFLDMTGFPFTLRNLTNSGKTQAIFGAFSYAFNKLTVSAELRYSKEDKAVLDTRANLTLSDEFSNTIPRFTLDYQYSDDTLLYASAAKGLKTGGFNGINAGAVTIPEDERAFGPESNWTYEIGAKSTLLDGRMLLNVALFNVDWTNMQIQALPSNTPPELVVNTPVIYRNIGNARSRGIEIESLVALNDNWSLNIGASFTDPTYKDGTDSFRFNGRCDDVVCPIDTSVGGNTLPRTAKTQLIAGLEWNSTLGNGMEIFARGDLTHQSKMQMEEMNIGQIPPRTLVNARLGVSRDNWALDVWGRNIFNEKYVANSFFIISGVSYGTALGEKATYGATLRYMF